MQKFKLLLRFGSALLKLVPGMITVYLILSLVIKTSSLVEWSDGETVIISFIALQILYQNDNITNTLLHCLL